jgi:hypothetical protein
MHEQLDIKAPYHFFRAVPKIERSVNGAKVFVVKNFKKNRQGIFLRIRPWRGGWTFCIFLPLRQQFAHFLKQHYIMLV